MSDLIDALRETLRANPEATPIALHLAELLLDRGEPNQAIAELGVILSKDPANAEARQLLQRALGSSAAPAAGHAAPEPAAPVASPAAPTDADGSADADGSTDADTSTAAQNLDSVDWAQLEREVDVDIAPPFVSDGSRFAEVSDETDGEHNADGYSTDGYSTDKYDDEYDEEYDDDLIRIRDGEQAVFFEDPQRERITLADVGGLNEVKERLRVAFLEPMRNPEIAKAYGKNLRGGLLLYGPPGTGKTYLAKAVAGELDARFLTVTVADILDGVMGASEKNVRRVFDRARELAPCVLFIDELDSLGGKRSGYSNLGWMRNVVNQLLQEMDGVGSENDGVFILAATNHPWDVDNALLRPGRFDRVVLVTPPDGEARAAILKHALQDRPISGIDLDQAVAATHGFTGADLTHLAASAAERAMSDSLSSGELRPIGMDDLRAALAEVRPSTGPWLQSARNVVEFANVDGRYDDLQRYLAAEQSGRPGKQSNPGKSAKPGRAKKPRRPWR